MDWGICAAHGATSESSWFTRLALCHLQLGYICGLSWSMMRAAILLIMLALCSSACAEDQEALRAELTRTYREWRASLMAKSVTAWQKYTTAHRQALTRNLIVSQGQRYPDAIFAIPMIPPDTATLKLLELEVVGETAHMVMFGKVDVGLETEEIPESLLVLKYLKDKDGWRFDSTRVVNLGDTPEKRDSIKAGDLDFLKHAPFNPPGVAPAIPKPCRKPDRVAAVRVHAVGYAVTPHMGGFDYPVVENNAEQHLLMGGLQWGAQTLSIDVREVALPVPDADKILSVEVVVLTGREEKPSVRVFHWEPAAPPAGGKQDLTVTLDVGTLKGF
jgi:hypothetical protein